MNRFQPHELVVVGVDTEAEEKTSIAAVDELVVAELEGTGVSVSFSTGRYACLRRLQIWIRAARSGQLR